MSPAQRRQMVDREHPFLSLVRQCALLGVSRSSVYYRPRAASEQDLSLMGEIDRQYLETPFYGSRRMKACLERRGKPASRVSRAAAKHTTVAERKCTTGVMPEGADLGVGVATGTVVGGPWEDYGPACSGAEDSVAFCRLPLRR